MQTTFEDKSPAELEALSTPEHYLKMLVPAMEDYVDYIPDFIVDSTTPPTPEGKHYKVRHGWFFQIGGNMALMEMDGYFDYDDDLHDRVRQFLATYFADSFKKRLTTAADIQAGNELLREVIDGLKEGKLVPNLPIDS